MAGVGEGGRLLRGVLGNSSDSCCTGKGPPRIWGEQGVVETRLTKMVGVGFKEHAQQLVRVTDP